MEAPLLKDCEMKLDKYTHYDHYNLKDFLLEKLGSDAEGKWDSFTHNYFTDEGLYPLSYEILEEWREEMAEDEEPDNERIEELNFVEKVLNCLEQETGEKAFEIYWWW